MAVFLALFNALTLLPSTVSAEETTAEPGKEGSEADSNQRPDAVIRSGLPVPRFVSLRSGQVNIRTGPGVRYPVDWTFVRAGMPVEITAEFDTWRRVRDWEGTQGWVHQSMLSGRRAFVVLGTIATLRDKPEVNGAAVAMVEPGVMGRIKKCADDWCRVESDGYEGWLRRTEIWGVYSDETVKE